MRQYVSKIYCAAKTSEFKDKGGTVAKKRKKSFYRWIAKNDHLAIRPALDKEGQSVNYFLTYLKIKQKQSDGEPCQKKKINKKIYFS